MHKQFSRAMKFGAMTAVGLVLGSGCIFLDAINAADLANLDLPSILSTLLGVSPTSVIA